MLRFIAALTGGAALAALSVASSPTQPVPTPYWIGDFRSGNYCQYATIFESSTVNPIAAPEGYVPACPQYARYARDPTQRVYLARRPKPPTQAASRWVSHQELRTTDGPWFPSISTAKATIRLTPEQTMGGSSFLMGSVRWFRVSIYLPNPGFNWPTSSWYTLLDIHNSVNDVAGNDWPTLTLMVTPRGRTRYVAFELDGVRAGSNYEVVKLLQLTKPDGARIVEAARPAASKPRAQPVLSRPFDRWHTLVFGVKFTDQGTIGDSPGWVKIYFDNRLVYSKARPNVWSGETGLWLQLQNYKSQAAGFVDGATVSKVYFADARIGYSRASVSR